MNNVNLLGRLTKNPDIRYTQSNIPVANFTLAVNRKFAKQGEERKADFIQCIAWNKTAEFMQKYIQKGQQIAVTGRIETRNYEDNNGNKHYITEVVVESVDFADSKKEEQPVDITEDVISAQGDDLPF